MEPARGYLKLPNGRALTGQSHDCKRHGTTTLFAALEVATGRIIAAHSKRRRRVEFLGFMNSVLAEKRVDPSNLRAPGQRYAFESVNALPLGVRRIEIVSGLLLLLAAASNCRNAATALRA